MPVPTHTLATVFTDERIARFWTQVQKGDGCWSWRNKPNKKGYGRVHWYGEIWLAHRLSWVLHHGPIPHGLYICHHCDNPICVRPDHLFLGTPKDNAADMARKGRASRNTGAAVLHRNLTHCPQGHEYSDANTWRNARGHRSCRACHNAKQKQRYVDGPTVPPKYTVTHCRHGHEYTPENSYIRGDGTRMCRTCHREKERRARRWVRVA